MHRYLTFLSYERRYAAWVETLKANLERGLAHAGRPGDVFLDTADLGSGRSWVAQLQDGLDQAEHFVLVATPEAFASQRVADEWESFIATRRDWLGGHFHVAWLVDAPFPTFLERVQRVDFREPDHGKYRDALRRLLAGLLERPARDLPELPPDTVLPEPPPRGLPPELRRRLVAALGSLLEPRIARRALARGLGLDPGALEMSPATSAASAALVRGTGDDEPVRGAIRVLEVVRRELEDDAGALGPIRRELEALRDRAVAGGLLRTYLDQVAREHGRLVSYFQQQGEMVALDRVYVRLELRPGERPAPGRGEAMPGRPLGIRELLALDPGRDPWVTRRWVVAGDPGAGKTTLLRHLAAELAREPDPPWVPILVSLPRLLREREWLLDRLARGLERSGHKAQSLPNALEQEGHQGRLLLLFDGLDEVPREDREDAATCLRDLSARWPRTPIVITTRPIGYRPIDAGFRRVDLLPLDRERRGELLARWLGRHTGAPDEERARRELVQLEGDPTLWELSGNPLYLTLIALLLVEGVSPARNRTRLYDQVFALLLAGKHRDPPTPIDRPDAVRRALRHLGHEMTRANLDAEPRESVEARLYAPEANAVCSDLERVPRWRGSLRPFLDDLAGLTGILGPHDGEDADWRFWHRTFREALAAEHLEEVFTGNAEALLAHARSIAGNEGQWAEPYALLAGRVAEPDALVLRLVEANPTLGVRALATASTVGDDTVARVLELSDDWQERSRVYERLPDLVGEPERTLALVARLARRTRDGNDLFFLDRAARLAGERWPERAAAAERCAARLYDHIPPPPEDLFTWIDSPLDGRVPLWCDVPAGDQVVAGHRFAVGPFRIAAVPVTNAQYEAFDDQHDRWRFKGVEEDDLARHPVGQVTWYEAVAFCRWLAARAPWGQGARLPTEAEWEHACRAGSEKAYWSGDGEADLARVGWYEANSGGRTHRVAEKPANPWGLYDVHGNVWEWTASPYRDAGEADGEEAAEPRGDARVLRGGGFRIGAGGARSAYRDGFVPGFRFEGIGFRVLLPVAPSSLAVDPRS